MWGVCLTHPMLALILSGDFLLHILCWFQFYLGSFCYTSRAGFNIIWGVSLTYPALASFFIWGISLTHPVLAFILSAEFLLHIPCWLQFYLGSFSYTSRAGFICMRGVSITHPVLASILSWRCLLHVPCWLHLYAGSFSYTSCASFFCFFI